MNKDDKLKFAQHEVFRRCFDRKYSCDPLNFICVIKTIASHLKHKLIVTDQNKKIYYNSLELTNFEKDKSDVDLKEKVTLAILYQSNTAYSIKTHNGLINKNIETASKEKLPLLIIIYDDNYGSGYCNKCNKKLDAKYYLTSCDHKFHIECMNAFKEKNSHTGIATCPFCSKHLTIVQKKHPFEKELKDYLKNTGALISKLKELHFGWRIDDMELIKKYFKELYVEYKDQYFDLEKFYISNFKTPYHYDDHDEFSKVQDKYIFDRYYVRPIDNLIE